MQSGNLAFCECNGRRMNSLFLVAPGVAQIPSSRASCIARATYHGSVMAEPGSKYAVVVARFNSLITKGLLEGAMETFEAHGVPKENVDVSTARSALCVRMRATESRAVLQVAWVPGSFEMPVIAKSMAKSGKYAGVVCIGAVVSWRDGTALVYHPTANLLAERLGDDPRAEHTQRIDLASQLYWLAALHRFVALPPTTTPS